MDAFFTRTDGRGYKGQHVSRAPLFARAPRARALLFCAACRKANAQKNSQKSSLPVVIARGEREGREKGEGVIKMS